MQLSFLERFAGSDELDPHQLAANPAIERPLTLQLLFDQPLELDSGRWADTLATLHLETADARLEMDEPAEVPGKILALVGWGLQVIKVIAANEPLDRELVETALRPAHFSPALKDAARRHVAHALLYYGGFHTDPHEQYVALATVAASLAPFGTLMVLNAAAHTAFPAPALLPDAHTEDFMEFLRGLPIPMLYGGFAKYEVEDVPGVWMRTHGNHLLDLPDLAYHATDHYEGENTLDLFTGILDYARTSGQPLAAGHTMEAGADRFWRLRAPTTDEWYLRADGDLFVLEAITAAEANTPAPTREDSQRI
jgi:hypothetical protein